MYVCMRPVNIACNQFDGQTANEKKRQTVGYATFIKFEYTNILIETVKFNDIPLLPYSNCDEFKNLFVIHPQFHPTAGLAIITFDVYASPPMC